MDLTRVGREFGARFSDLERGYRSILAEAEGRAGAAYEHRAAEAKKGLDFLDGLKSNLYYFSQELNQIPGGLEPARQMMQRSAVPALKAVLQKAEAHMASLDKDSSVRSGIAGGMGVWYNPLTWYEDAKQEVASTLVKTAAFGLLVYGAVKLIDSKTKAKH